MKTILKLLRFSGELSAKRQKGLAVFLIFQLADPMDGEHFFSVLRQHNAHGLQRLVGKDEIGGDVFPAGDLRAQTAQLFEGSAARTGCIAFARFCAGLGMAGRIAGFDRRLRSLPCRLHGEHGAEFPVFRIEGQSLFFHFQYGKPVVGDGQVFRQNQILADLSQKDDRLTGL